MNRTALIAGAGFAAEASLPLTRDLSRGFTVSPECSATPDLINERISEHLQNYWAEVFRYRKGSAKPTFEDHFTVLDLAANRGHNLGLEYTPAKLRAIRRMSIHRVFDILDNYQPSSVLAQICSALADGDDNALVSLNWDIVAENHLTIDCDYPRGFDYCIDASVIGSEGSVIQEGLPLIKLHGSSNWHYCDSCQHLTIGHPGMGKTALHFATYIKSSDFRRLGDRDEVVAEIDELCQAGPLCGRCGSPLSGRVATFSYSKALDTVPFHVSWHAALEKLREAKRWLFVGYSFPAADYEFRHLLKTAERAREDSDELRVEVIVKGNHGEEERFKQFFGEAIVGIDTDGLRKWVSTEM